MIDLNVSVTDTGAISGLNAIIGRLRTRDIIDEANAFFLNRIRTNFLAEVNPQGVRWTPSQAGIRRRAAGGTGTLFDTGRLFRSIQVANTSLYSSRIFTDVPYAPSLQNNYPYRQFLGWGAQDQILLNRLVTIRLNAILGGRP